MNLCFLGTVSPVLLPWCCLFAWWFITLSSCCAEFVLPTSTHLYWGVYHVGHRLSELLKLTQTAKKTQLVSYKGILASSTTPCSCKDFPIWLLTFQHLTDIFLGPRWLFSAVYLDAVTYCICYMFPTQLWQLCSSAPLVYSKRARSYKVNGQWLQLFTLHQKPGGYKRV